MRSHVWEFDVGLAQGIASQVLMHILAEIKAMPLQYHTLVCDIGSFLSDGQQAIPRFKIAHRPQSIAAATRRVLFAGEQAKAVSMDNAKGTERTLQYCLKMLYRIAAAMLPKSVAKQ